MKITLYATASITFLLANNCSAVSTNQWKDYTEIKQELDIDNMPFNTKAYFVHAYNLPHATKEERKNQQIVFNNLQKVINYKYLDLMKKAYDDFPQGINCASQYQQEGKLNTDCFLLAIVWNARIATIKENQEILEMIALTNLKLAQQDSGPHIQEGGNTPQSDGSENGDTPAESSGE